MRVPIPALAAAIAITMIGTALAEDFTFAVPVDINSLDPAINRARVSCAVSAPGRGIVGSRALDIHLTGGEYHGDVVVAFNATVLGEAALATEYACRITDFYGIGTDGRGFSYIATDYATPTRFFPLAPGAPVVLSTYGSLP